MSGKKYTAAATKIESNKLYSLEEAISLVKETSTTKFDASVELHVRLGINTEKAEEAVRGTATLPQGTGKEKRVAVFTERFQEEAKKAGAQVVGGKELIQEIKSSQKIDFDIAIADPEIMKDLAIVAKVLGPKGFMPSPKNDTVRTDIAAAVAEMRGGKVAFKNDAGGNVHQVIGKVSWDVAKLFENARTFLESLRKMKPPSSKGIFIQAVYLASSMGPSVRVAV